MSKYHSRKITYEGEAFDSKKEFRRWQELRLLEKAGRILNLRRQQSFELIPPQYETVERYSPKTGKRLKDGKHQAERAVYYVSDFVYDLPDGTTVVEDSKGVRTDAYIIKRKLMLYIHGIKIYET